MLFCLSVDRAVGGPGFRYVIRHAFWQYWQKFPRFFEENFYAYHYLIDLCCIFEGVKSENQPADLKHGREAAKIAIDRIRQNRPTF
jgi:hypothetical protein